ncbi:primosomal replication protein N [Rhodoferax sp.]|uniref:primosomal replication protein N n=1 Tax=Rhodoferax sp. TaxID=50421 RepID=UPI002614A3F6|nr:primosomal replication protein N [Rhodoferax sp.]MDD2808309.1 primosomal replication protein N [Rhodoferax sp.]
MNAKVNQLVLTASIVEIESLRYTPSGVPALNFKLEHASEITEAGKVRQVKALIKSVSLGTVAESLAKQDIGSQWVFHGFLSTPRNTKQIVFHIHTFVKD